MRVEVNGTGLNGSAELNHGNGNRAFFVSAPGPTKATNGRHECKSTLVLFHTNAIIIIIKPSSAII